MFGFLIKKTFFDLWDHFLPAIIVNLGCIVLLSIPLLLPSVAAGGGTAAAIAVLCAGVFIVFIFLGGVYSIAGEITNYATPTWGTFITGVKTYLPVTVTLGGIAIAHVFLITVGIPVYLAMNNAVGLIAVAFLFWMSVIWVVTAQYVLPVRGRLDRNLKKVLKKSFLLSFDNVLFSVAVALGSVVIIAISVFTALLFPGIMGLAIWHHGAVKLRLYKYDYYEENPEASRSDIPWDALIFDDRERVGPRTLRGMIFPWKE